jgi:hypothetical protein
MFGDLQLEINPEQINLKSFKPKEELNPKIFINEDKMNSKVRLRLLDIADDFVEYLDILFAKPLDIVIVGSIVGYQWSKYSDIDLHVIYDFNDISNRTKFVREYFDAKKNIWNQERKIKIYGYDVECYVENLNDPSVSNGKYSIEKNTWLQFPSKTPTIRWEKYYIKEKSAKIMDLIEMYEKDFEINKDDEYNLIDLANKINKLWSKIKSIRKDGIEKQGEMSVGNIIYKVCRRSGYLGRLYKLKQELYVYGKSIR